MGFPLGCGGCLRPDRGRLERWRQNPQYLGYGDKKAGKARRNLPYCLRPLSSLERRRGADERNGTQILPLFHQLVPGDSRGGQGEPRRTEVLFRSGGRADCKRHRAAGDDFPLGSAHVGLQKRRLAVGGHRPAVPGVYQGGGGSAVRPGKMVDDHQRAGLLHHERLYAGRPCPLQA